jgi:hypothetical protein
MNILLSINEFEIENIIILESKENLVINGVFNKMLYSNSYFTMNGIFIYFPIINYDIQFFNGKNIVYFNIEENYNLIFNFSKLENDILHFYIKSKDIQNKTIINSFEKHLKNGMIKIYKSTFSKKKFYIKISGVWETSSDIGITYKLIYY